jgi:hypothetical protein
LIAVDSTILVYAHRRDSPWHKPAAATIKGLAEGSASWAIAWHSLHEFYATVTHPRIYAPPTPIDRALKQIELWLAAPGLVLLSEPTRHWAALATLLKSGKVTGPAVYDARIAALCLVHGVTELWTADRDFSRWPSLRTRNPLVS